MFVERNFACVGIGVATTGDTRGRRDRDAGEEEENKLHDLTRRSSVTAGGTELCCGG